MNETRHPDTQNMSIVALGSFNPAIFHPYWFARHGLIKESEVDLSGVKLCSPEVTVVNSEWFTLQVTSNRFSLESSDPRKFHPLRDLVASIFDILEHTPVRAFGLNSIHRLECQSADEWHQFGHHFAPKHSWNDLLTNPGLRTLTISGKLPDVHAERVQITIEPAMNFGVTVNINEHYKLFDKDDLPNQQPSSAIEFRKILEERWDGFIAYSLKVDRHLLNEGKL